MWNKSFNGIQEPAYKRLGLAICVSVLLHFFLMGNFYKLLPNHQPAIQLIEARLQLSKPRAKPAPILPDEVVPDKVVADKVVPDKAPPITKKIVKTKPVKAPKLIKESVKKPEPAQEPAPPVEPLANENIAPAAVSPPKLSEPYASAGKSDNINEPLPAPDAMPIEVEDENAALHKKAYQYVETTFNVSTKIGGSPEGIASMTYNLLDGVHYQINSVARARGLAALVLSELVQTSEGVLTKSGLQPNKFTYNYGDNASKSRLATFDWQSNTVSMQTAKGLETDDLPLDAQDLLSFMYQFMYVPPLNKMHITIVNGKSLRGYDYSFEGEETTTLPIGEVKTVHIQHSNTDTEDKIDLWLAVDYQYLPVKILKTDKKGKIYEFTAVNLKTLPAAQVPPINY